MQFKLNNLNLTYLCLFTDKYSILMCQLIDDELATEALRIFLQVDNFKTFYAVFHAIEEKGINVLAALWPILIQMNSIQQIFINNINWILSDF